MHSCYYYMTSLLTIYFRWLASVKAPGTIMPFLFIIILSGLASVNSPSARSTELLPF